MKQLFAILLLSILFFACDKKEDITEIKQTVEYSSVFTFTNTTNYKLTVDVYTNADDYKYSRNAIRNYTVDKNSRYTDSIATTINERLYYLDIYNSDKTASIWGYWFKTGSVGEPNRDSILELGYYHTWHVESDRPRDLTLSQYYIDKLNWRNLLINGNNPETVWKAVGGANWATLNNEQKYLKLVVSKDMRCVYARMKNGEVEKTNAWLYIIGYTQPEELTIEQDGKIEYLKPYNGDTLLLTTTYGDMYITKE